MIRAHGERAATLETHHVFPKASGDPSDEVEVVETEADELAGADGGLKHEPDDGLVAAVIEGVRGAGPFTGSVVVDGAGC